MKGRREEQPNNDSLGARKAVQQMDRQRALFGLLFALQNRLQAVGDSFYEEITCKQFFLLACLCLFPEQPPTAQDLAQVMGCSHQNVKQLLNKLEQKDMVHILVDEEDRRKLRIVPTEHSMEVETRYHEQELQFIEQLFAGVSEEEAGTAFAILGKMEQNLIQIKNKEGA